MKPTTYLIAVTVAGLLATYPVRAAPAPLANPGPWEFLVGSDGEVAGVVPSGSSSSSRSKGSAREMEVGFGGDRGRG
jgi:hypothetical protein